MLAMLAISGSVLIRQPIKAAVTYDYVVINGYRATASLGFGTGYARANTIEGTKTLHLTSQVNGSFSDGKNRSPLESGFGLIEAYIKGRGKPVSISGYHTASGYGQTKKMVTSA